MKDREIYKLANKNSRRLIWEAQESKRRELMEEIGEGIQQTLLKIEDGTIRCGLDGPNMIQR